MNIKRIFGALLTVLGIAGSFMQPFYLPMFRVARTQ